jgi:predicted Holliday junction resolvase-like endonuclease
MKTFIAIVLALVLICLILILIIKSQRAEKKKLKDQIEDYKAEYFELTNRFEKLLEENEIEKKHNKELAKKLADISCMSIDDVLQQLQND